MGSLSLIVRFSEGSETRETTASARERKKEPLPLSVERVVMFMSRAFWYTD